MKDKLKQVYFSLDEDNIYIGYILENNFWNGWLCPYVTKEVFDLIVYEYTVKRKLDNQEENPWLDLAKTKPSEDGLYDVSHGFCWSEVDTINDLMMLMSESHITDEQIINFYYDLVSLGNQMLAENKIDQSKFYFAELKKVNKIIKLRNLSVEEWI